MDKFFRPEKLDVDPNSSNAGKSWEHWFRTFDNFILSINEPNLNKLNLLVNFVSPTVYEYISECGNYNQAIDILRKLYVKPKNEIYARHMLTNRRQNPSESLDEFLQNLKNLSKDCNYKAVSADLHREEAIRGAFISGLISNVIRQRLLENPILSLATAFDQARSLDQAQKNSDSFSFQSSSTAAAISPESKNLETVTAIEETVYSASTNKASKCYFCGNNRQFSSVGF